MSDTSGFYKLDPEGRGLFYAPNFVLNSEFELHAELCETYTYPVDGWTWFDSSEKAYLAFGTDPSMNTNYITLLADSTLIAAGESVESPWFDFKTLNLSSLFITRSSTPDIYVFEIDWSDDGIAARVTEVVTIVNNTSVSKTVAARYGKLRIRNTDTVASFMVHTTIVTGK